MVTQDNADRLTLLAIAAELDAPGARPQARPAFSFFRQASNRLCHAIIHPQHPGNDSVLRGHLKRIDDERLKRALAAALAIETPRAKSVTTLASANRDLWRGLAPMDRKRT
ncbi:MAG: hypothetical protein KGL35_19275 [Bradyrhizobium sp.]|nr:hypothetical protein [Bradyrhizobium sp.]